ncbi:hypothetical protein EDB86DRAFT_824654 [Lactarius hatsudake]|nr:hypothetical protein EDB86DRAFT_824654 [Lactarius hatsudake]
MPTTMTFPGWRCAWQLATLRWATRCGLGLDTAIPELENLSRRRHQRRQRQLSRIVQIPSSLRRRTPQASAPSSAYYRWRATKRTSCAHVPLATNVHASAEVQVATVHIVCHVR